MIVKILNTKLILIFVFVILLSLGMAGLFYTGYSTRSWTRPAVTVAVTPIVATATSQSLTVPIVAPNNQEPPVRAEISKQVNILFFGDMMLDRYVRQIIKRRGVDYLFANLKTENIFENRDFVGANLEGAVTESGAHLAPAYANDFAFAPADVLSLKQYNFNVFNLANNHIADQGEAGEKSTREFLEENQFNYFGCRDRQVAECTSHVTTKGSTSVAWLGFSQVYGRLDESKVRGEIRAAKKQADFVVVNIHWGNEYQEQFNSKQQILAHAMVEAGADVIIGHHPHVVQGIEEYRNRPIYYSLGNFIFDQYFSSKTQQGLGVALIVSENRIEAQLLPLNLSKSRPKLMTNKDKQLKLQNIAELSVGNDAFKNQIKSGLIVISQE